MAQSSVRRFPVHDRFGVFETAKFVPALALVERPVEDGFVRAGVEHAVRCDEQ